MSLYQTSVLKNYYINLQEKDIVEKAYKKYTKYFLNPTIQEGISCFKEENELIKKSTLWCMSYMV